MSEVRGIVISLVWSLKAGENFFGNCSVYKKLIHKPAFSSKFLFVSTILDKSANRLFFVGRVHFSMVCCLGEVTRLSTVLIAHWGFPSLFGCVDVSFK